MGEASDIELLLKAHAVTAKKSRWKRAWTWILDVHKGVLSLLAIVATGTVVNAWIHGIPSNKTIDDTVQTAVEKAVKKALADTQARVTVLETNTGGLPEFRGGTTTKLEDHEKRIAKTEAVSDAAYRLADSRSIRGNR